MAERYSFHLTKPLPPERADELTAMLYRAEELVHAMAWPAMPPIFREAETTSGAYRIMGTLTVGSSIFFEAAGLDVQPLLVEVLKTLSVEFDMGWTVRKDGARIGYVTYGKWKDSKKPPEKIPFASEKKKGWGRKVLIFLILLILLILIFLAAVIGRLVS